MPRGNRLERAHVGGLAVQVHRHDRSRAGTNRRLDARRIEREALGIDVHEHRSRARHDHRERGERGGEGRRDDLVPLADIERAQHQRDGIGAGTDGNGVGGATCRRELGFERLDFRPEDVPPAGDDAFDGGRDGFGILPGPEGIEGDAAGRGLAHDAGSLGRADVAIEMLGGSRRACARNPRAARPVGVQPVRCLNSVESA